MTENTNTELDQLLEMNQEIRKHNLNNIRHNIAMLKKQIEKLDNSFFENMKNVDENLNDIQKKLKFYDEAFPVKQIPPFENAVLANDLRVLTNFIYENDINSFFLPTIQQKPTILLEFLSQMLSLIDENEIFFDWIERALLDFDTQNRHIRESAPEVLINIQKKIAGIKSPKSKMIDHIIRSLLLDFKK